MAFMITNDPEEARANGWVTEATRRRGRSIVQVRTVTVEKVHGDGFKVSDGWLNVSRYANPGEVPMPSPGDTVRVSIDGSGFIRKIEPASAPKMPPDANNTVKLGGEGADTTPNTPTPETSVQESASAPEQPATPAPCVNQKDAQIARMNALSHAAVIVTHNAVINGATVRLEDVLACAERIENWITRPV